MDNLNLYNFKMHLLCTIKNIVILICYTFLAIYFNKWWIVLFGGLFLSSVKMERIKKDESEEK